MNMDHDADRALLDPMETASVDALREFLILRGDREVLGEKGLMCARNEEMCGLTEPLFDGDEVAFFPTVTGG